MRSDVWSWVLGQDPVLVVVGALVVSSVFRLVYGFVDAWLTRRAFFGR